MLRVARLCWVLPTNLKFTVQRRLERPAAPRLAAPGHAPTAAVGPLQYSP